MGKLIVIEGVDGTGKGTQSALLADYLRGCGRAVRLLEFPRYGEESSALTRMYLGGMLGGRPEDTGAFAASAFFAMDRYVSWRTDWHTDADDPATVVIANRYTTANAVHQLSKLPRGEWDSFLEWLWDFEFVKLGIPRPDLVLYFDMPPEISMRLVNQRSRATGQAKDIHELDASHIRASREAALYSAAKLDWRLIHCWDGDNPLPREVIAGVVREITRGVL